MIGGMEEVGREKGDKSDCYAEMGEGGESCNPY